MDAPFNITREELLELAAQKLADGFGSTDDIHETAYKLIARHVEDAFSNGIKGRIDNFLSEEMSRIVSTEICPVNIWGEREGSPTTIRAALAQRARDFWSVKVDAEGRPTSYGGTPRSEQLMAKILRDEFAQAVKHNADVIVGEFKAAILADATALVKANIDKLITSRPR